MAEEETGQAGKVEEPRVTRITRNAKMFEWLKKKQDRQKR
jgi:hypothetical protein